MDDELELCSLANDGAFDEFLVTLAGADNHWMFISSGGGLTAGRQDADHSLFPYGTVDKVMASRGDTGPKTLIRDEEKNVVWEPFADWTKFVFSVKRTVAKNKVGTLIQFTEVNEDLALAFSYSWQFSRKYGFVRQAALSDRSGRERKVSVLDGLQNILSPGITHHLQSELSCLVDAYKDNVIDPDSGLAVFSLSALVTDKAAPAEALGASVAWFVTRTPAELTLDRAAVGDFAAGRPFAPAKRAKGKRADIFAHRTIPLPASGRDEWIVCADRGLDAADVRRLSREISGLKDSAVILADVADNRRRLFALIASCDGTCAGAVRMHEWHHFSNVLYNSLRGGIPLDGYTAHRADVLEYLAIRNSRSALVAEKLLPARDVTIEELTALSRKTDDPDLSRLLREYLPLGFSRRHGDPSRPWNRFSIRVADDEGNPVCAFQGNWRDIFQNWEALSVSWPGYLPGFIAAFLDATTLDGYNPYRVGRDGVDWERPDPENPWANIGYWSDHQIIYLQKLFERTRDHFPGLLEAELGGGRYSYARVPYRIADFDATCRNPRATISFDAELDREIEALVARDGTDARLVRGADGFAYEGTLAEKLLSLALPKLANFVPGGGVWVNAQRPEWNDANNALVGAGLSVVTLAYLRRFLAFWIDVLAPLAGQRFAVAGDLAGFARESRAALESDLATRAVENPLARYAFMETMGRSAERFRAGVYRNMTFADPSAQLPAEEISALFAAAISAIDATLAGQRREYGLFHSYNILSLDLSSVPRAAMVENLQIMLEGQVAILSSGFLSAEDAADLLEALPATPLYRADKNSYVLYPAKDTPDFFCKNAFAESRAREIPLFARLLDDGNREIVTASGDGYAHFGSGMENAEAVSLAIDRLGGRPEYASLARAGKADALELYESVFRHSSYTGRSGTMYAFEGIGSIYWHMVSKLLLAAGELFEAAAAKKAGESGRFASSYAAIRDGLGYRRGAEDYGAFPWDPYSHTPAGAFARQPGMTGQVKEEILTRLIETGVRVRDGRISFSAAPFMREEALPSGTIRSWRNAPGSAEVEIKEGEFGLSFCGIPIVRSIALPKRLRVFRGDRETVVQGAELSAEVSRLVFSRASGITHIRAE